MTEQLELLTKVAVSRTSAPETSHIAEDEITKSGRRANLQHRVVSLVLDWPERTTAEYYELYRQIYQDWDTRLDTFRARFSELKDTHIVQVYDADTKKIKKVICPIANRWAVIWRAI